MKTRTLKLVTALLTVVLLVGAIVGIGVVANAEDYTASLGLVNVAYNEKTQLAFQVTTAGTAADGQTAGIIVWEDTTLTEYTVANSSYTTFDAATSGSITYYKANGVAADELSKQISVAACIKTGDEVTITSDVVTYSVMQYAIDRLNDGNATVNQMALYENLLVYGIASEAVIGDKTAGYGVVKAVDGYVGVANASVGGGLVNSSVLLRAEAVNPDGEYFLRWENADGETLTSDRLMSVEITDAKLVTYTAVYGAQADSKYADTRSFQNIDAGALELASGTGTPTVYGYGPYEATGSTPKLHWSLTYTDPVDAAWYLEHNNPATATTDESGNTTYTEDGKMELKVVESANGDKELTLYNQFKSRGYGFYSDVQGSGATAVEMDITYVTNNHSAVCNGLIFALKDADGNALTKTAIRINFFMLPGSDSMYLYCETDNTKQDDGTYTYEYPLTTVEGSAVPEDIPYEAGQTFTVKIAIVDGGTDEAGTALEDKFAIYINGVCYGAVPLAAFNITPGSTFDATNIAEITQVNLTEVRNTFNTVSLDNITFIR